MRNGKGQAKTLMTISDLASFLKISPSTLYRLVREGDIEHHRIGAAIRFDLEQVLKETTQRRDN